VRNIEPHAVVLLVRSGAEVARWPLVGPWRPDLAMIDDLARSQLAVRRLGCSLELYQVRPQLKALLTLVGLATTIPCVDLRDFIRVRPTTSSAVRLRTLSDECSGMPPSALVGIRFDEGQHAARTRGVGR
jgi:hypothetical protein